MTVAGRINLMVVSTASVMALLILISSGIREYFVLRDGLVSELTTEITRETALAADLQLRERRTLHDFLERLQTLSPAITYVRIDTVDGIEVVEQSRIEEIEGKLPPLNVLRGGAANAETGLSPQQGLPPPEAAGLMASLTGGELVLNASIPILSGLNPLREDLTRRDFGESLAQPTGSQFVAGYVHVGVSRSMLLVLLLPTLGTLAGIALGLLLVGSFIVTRYTRKLTGPLARLARMADDITAGNVGEPLTIDGEGEVKEIANVLNAIIGGLHNYKTQIGVDHQLLSMKVEERTAQLSQRNQELNQAVRQVTETKDRLRQMAYFDSLTSLPNRRLFTEQLDLLLRLSKRNNEKLALLFLDLDNFKRVNDSLGHSAGDALLKEVARRLAACVRESDVVAHFVDSESRIDVSRLGGDEFTVVLNQVEDERAVRTVAQRLLDTLLQPVSIGDHELVITPSIGIAMAPDHASDLEGLLKAADTAMFHAKSQGKNTYMFYTPDMDAAGVERLRLETDLRKALERNELLFHYQPQVDTRTGTVIGVEALIRWQHPEQGMIPPFRFVPVAEEIGLIGELGSWGIRQACRELVDLRQQGYALPKIAVNVSALQFTRNFCPMVREALQTSGLPASSLELELTESILVEDSETTVRALRELKAMGLRLSIDDFGTGYSSLSYLSRFPLDELKIDRSFVIDFDKSENDASLVRAIIAMGQSMNLDLVAEGVETSEQFNFLTTQGANVIQGYLFSRPVTAEELKPMLAPGYFMEQIREIRADL
ncbi:putative bifunctional diguanylate cyclase/phosphodiesterase [Haliea sp.]|uniref:putative bifunctional diguanylate cyclase/phosphodiesterase n=1 Tax=Haliea sp. TaxID=1932666 RepID=UPI003528E19B